MTVLALAAVCAGNTTAHAGADDSTVTLSFAGREGTRVRGRCLVRMPEGERRLDLDEAVPFERRWRASGLRCELEAPVGPVTVDAALGGSRSRISIGGGKVTFSLG